MGSSVQMVRIVTKLPTIRLQKDFRRIFADGRRFTGRLLTVVVAAPATVGATRVAFIAGRKVGNAVQRNRAKRRLREAVRKLIGDGEQARDVIVIAKPGAAEADYWALEAELAELLASAGVTMPGNEKG